METIAQQIQEQDNVLYSQVLGVDFDTTGFGNYRNDSLYFTFQNQDSIFSAVNERSFYAAEMLALQLEKLEATSHRFKNNKNAI